MFSRTLKRQGWVVGVLAASYAHAATLTGIQGEVLLSRSGSSFQSVKNTTDVFAGDSVTVKPGGLAHIIYDDGCDVTVRSGGVITVTQPSPCAAKAKTVKEPSLPSNQGLNATTLVIGGVAIAGIVVGVTALSRDKPASP
ncbi:MAG: hypothetical protein F9K44_11230 [Hyphomicrobiaceae bacterium]|nr:MAG: hypothetical protein F9K44_11230 [Hyphomicrobiaceae bacterium]